jgi:hypothetical protein
VHVRTRCIFEIESIRGVDAPSSDQPDTGVVQCCQQRRPGITGDLHRGVDDRDDPSGRLTQREVATGGVANPILQREVQGCIEGCQALRRSVVDGVVDDDELPVARQMRVRRGVEAKDVAVPAIV